MFTGCLLYVKFISGINFDNKLFFFFSLLRYSLLPFNLNITYLFYFLIHFIGFLLTYKSLNSYWFKYHINLNNYLLSIALISQRFMNIIIIKFLYIYTLYYNIIVFIRSPIPRINLLSRSWYIVYLTCLSAYASYECKFELLR